MHVDGTDQERIINERKIIAIISLHFYNCNINSLIITDEK